METKSVAKLGAVVILAIVAFFGLYFYLSHLTTNTYKVKVHIKDTKGLSKQSVVHMQGVSIGEVTSVDLDTTQRPFSPVITLAIKRNFDIPENSQVAIVSGILITTAQVDVRPDKNPSINSLPKDGSAEVTGAEPASTLAAISPAAEETIKNLETLSRNINDKLNATFGKVNRTFDDIHPILQDADRLVNTTNDTARTAKDILTSPKVRNELEQTLTNFKKVSVDAGKTSGKLSAYVDNLTNKTQGPLEKLPSKLNDVLSHVDATLDNADTVVSKLTEQVTDPRFQQSLQETAELAKTTIARFNQIATDLHELTGDPKLQSDLKHSVDNLSVMTEKSKDVIDKINTLLGKITGPDGKLKATPRIPPITVTADVSEQLSPTRLRVDLNSYIPFGGNRQAIIGLYDVGQSTRFNLQATQPLGNELNLRYGLYASRIGGGLDYTPNKYSQFRADLWDTNRLRLDLRSTFRVQKGASLWIGADNVLRRTTPIIGVQINN